jgi:4-hydroxybenzoate polyprenyltransferase
MKNYLKLIRVKHWLKNFLVFLPLFFSMNLFNANKLLYCFLGFIVFSLTSSIIYIINDIRDVENDRKHETKKNRPLASGKVKIKTAIYVAILIFVLDVALLSYLYIISKDLLIVIVPLIYLILNILYSFGLKNKPVIDVVILVSGFLLRIIYGGLVVDIEVSKWLYLMIIFASFYLGFGKRRNEIIKNGDKSRTVLKFYTKEFLDKNMYVALTLAIVSYSLWCVDPLTIERSGTNLLFWTIPVVMVIFQLYSLNIEKDSNGDPIEVLMSDKSLLISVAAYLLLMFLILYKVI